MEWLDKMGDALDYIESNINGDINYAQAAKIACCSLSRFQSMFLFITDITLSEYVRRRRMALSAHELISSDIKIIDLSVKYGYESHAAFTRSYKSFHGISPTESRKFNKYNNYPRISFQLKITGGHFTMEQPKMEVYKGIFVKMETIEMPETLKFAGLSNVKHPKPRFKNIDVYHEKYKPLIEDKYSVPYTEIGVVTNITTESNRGDYIFGCLVDSIEGLHEDLVGVDTGLKKFACLTFRTPPSIDLLGNENEGGDGMKLASEYLYKKWIPKNIDLIYGYMPQYKGFKIEKKDFDYRIANISTDNIDRLANHYGFACFMEIYKTDIDMDNQEMCYYIPLV